MNLGRKALKAYFKKNSMPGEESFGKLIDSMVNIVDDGFSRSPGDGLTLAPQENTGGKLVSFFRNSECLEKDLPDFSINVKGDGEKAMLDFTAEPWKNTILTLLSNGNVGINRETPLQALDVNGTIASQGRMGNYPAASPAVPADGKWHTLIDGLDSLQAFEIVAAVYGITGKGRYAVLHAIALSAFGKSKSKIRATCARFGRCRNRIQLRWAGGLHNYRLEVRTRSDYGNNIQLQYHITRLWGY